jgi:hypothetical protein
MTPALAEAARAGGTTFSLLEIGARFVFNKDDVARPYCLLVKETPRAYRHLVGGRRWTTGAGTTVYRVTAE